MVDIRSIVNRFPLREFEIRRNCLRDNRFRSICSDYEEASTALEQWRNTGPAGAERAEEYIRFLQELEAEILAKLDTAPMDADRT